MRSEPSSSRFKTVVILLGIGCLLTLEIVHSDHGLADPLRTTKTPAVTGPSMSSGTPLSLGTLDSSNETFEAGDIVTTNAIDVNLRRGPALNADIVATLVLGDELRILDDQSVDADGFLWWHVRSVASHAEGWVIQDLISLDDSLAPRLIENRTDFEGVGSTVIDGVALTRGDVVASATLEDDGQFLVILIGPDGNAQVVFDETGSAIRESSLVISVAGDYRLAINTDSESLAWTLSLQQEVLATPTPTPSSDDYEATIAALQTSSADLTEVENVEVTIVAMDIFFDPDELTIPANTDVTIHLPNEGAAEHDFSIDALDIQINLPPGETDKRVIVNAPPGEYEFYCNIPGHKEAGMVGMLIVE